MKKIINVTQVRILLISAATLWLLGCSTTITPPVENNQNLQEIKITENHIKTLLQNLGNKTSEKYQIENLSTCRYQFTSQWSNLQKGIYRAQNIQRFNFTHDIRNIERSKAHILNYEDAKQHWDELIAISFNRKIPNTFKHIKIRNYQAVTSNGVDNIFTLGGLKTSTPEQLDELQAALIKLARLCGNNFNQINSIEDKILGRWELFGNPSSYAILVISDTTATLIDEHNQTISGRYDIEQQGQYHRLTINNQYHLLLDFHTSNYARLLILGEDPGPAPFAPYSDKLNTNYNPQEKLMFRLGDIR